MYCNSFTAAVTNSGMILVSAEVDIRNGLPGFLLCGASSQETKESKERVRVAIENAGFLMPPKRIIVNLSPGDVRKDGTQYDLAVAVAVLKAYGYAEDADLSSFMIFGELSLDGSVRPVKGCYSFARFSKDMGFTKVIVPYENGKEASFAEGITVYPVKTIEEALAALSGNPVCVRKRDEKEIEDLFPKASFGGIDPFKNRFLSPTVKKAMFTAFKGHHNMLLAANKETAENILGSFEAYAPQLNTSEKLEMYELKSLLTPENDNIVIGNGYVFIFDVQDTKYKEDVEKVYKYAPSGAVIISSFTCPCGSYPGKSCTCTQSKIKNTVQKISKTVFEKSVIFSEADSTPFIGKNEDEGYFKKFDGASFERVLPVRKPSDINDLPDDLKDVVMGSFSSVPYSERLLNNILSVADTLSGIYGSDLNKNMIDEAVDLCVFGIRRSVKDE